jgi:anti-sigma regulatory factor (Ser/Thr protein kinase)
VAVPTERLGTLRAALRGGGGVTYVDMSEMGSNPARTIPAWQSFIDDNRRSGTRLRGVGEPIWAGRRPVELAECNLHEALLNVAVDPDTPLWLRCPYDAAALEPAVLEEASRSHPVLVDADDYRGSLLYGGVEHVASSFAAALPEPRQPVDELRFDTTSTAAVRPVVVAHAAAVGLPAPRTADVALAITEAATNSVRHGGGEGTLRVWEDEGALVCEVRDAGRIDDPLAGRRMPSLEAEGGRGLWLANQLGDLVQVRSGEQGTAVRVHSWLESA